MKVFSKIGRDDVAVVYVAQTSNNKLVEFVESLEPPRERNEKWVLMVSTLDGCPVECKICDAGGDFKGILNCREMLEQIDYLVKLRYPSGKIPCNKFKIQFSRVGEPAFNNSVLEVLEKLPSLYDAPGLIPSVSTIAPRGRDDFFENLLQVKKRYYDERFQLQFSIHSTKQSTRDKLMPWPKWNFNEIARYSSRFYSGKGRKITLNFALAKSNIIDADVMMSNFDPDIFIIKITPVNPTFSANKNRIKTGIDFNEVDAQIIDLESKGFEVIKSIGELEENMIGSNCGQYLKVLKDKNLELKDAYTYKLKSVET